MPNDLGARLLRAGLVTRDQLAATLAYAPPHGGALVAALVARGVPEDALAGFFLAEGFGPLMEADDLASATSAALRRLPGAMAADLLALPVRASPAGLVVAMAAPADRHAVREIARVVGGEVLPTVACVSTLRAAIRAAYPGQLVQSATPEPAAERAERADSEPPVLELVRRRSSVPGDQPPATVAVASSAPGAPATVATGAASDPPSVPAALGPRLVADDEEELAVPLVRTKPQLTPPHGIRPSTAPQPAPAAPKVVSKAFARPDGLRRSSVPGRGTTRRGTAEYAAVKDESGELAAAIRAAAAAAAPPEPRPEAGSAPGAGTAAPGSASPAASGGAAGTPAAGVPSAAADTTAADTTATGAAASRAVTSAAPAPATHAPAASASSAPAASATGASVPPPSAPPRAVTVSPQATSPQAARAATSAPRAVTAAPSAPPGAARPTSIVPPEHERWDLGLAPPSPPAVPTSPARPSPSTGRAQSPMTSPKPSVPEVGGVLAGIRGTSDRDLVVRLACEGAVTVARAAVFLALRKGVLQGWEGAGGGLSRDALRNLWIPTATPSTFKTVVDDLEPYVGPYGSTVADGLFRAAVGSRGGDLALHPIVVTDKLVGILCADDLLPIPLAHQRMEVLAHAVSEAFKRIILEKKG